MRLLDCEIILGQNVQELWLNHLYIILAFCFFYQIDLDVADDVFCDDSCTWGQKDRFHVDNVLLVVFVSLLAS